MQRLIRVLLASLALLAPGAALALSAPTITITSVFRNPTVIGEVIYFLVQVTGDQGTATGTATVFVDGVPRCTNLALNTAGAALCPNSSGASRTTFSVTAQYSGDAKYSPGTAGPHLHTVIGVPSSLEITSSANPSVAGAAVTITATAFEVGQGPIIDQGTITFRENGVAIPGCTQLTTFGSSAQCTQAYAAGSRTIDATFSGSPDNGPLDPATSPPLVQVTNAATRPVRKVDFNADGKGDLLWRHQDKRHAVWLLNGATSIGIAQVLNAGNPWHANVVGDFDGDGKSDIVWWAVDGRVAIYLMNGTQVAGVKQILAPGPWTPIHAPDLDGDGKSDLVFQNVNGSVAVWLMDGVNVKAGATVLGPGSGWTVKATADFDGDGKDDFLWVHTDGRHAIWLMNGLQVKQVAQILNTGTGWYASHTPDLDGDGKADIVWQNIDGRISVWLMNGTVLAGGATLFGPGSGWHVTRTGDLNGDGKADLFLLHNDGRAAVWLMNGATPVTQALILNGGAGWYAIRLADMDGDGKADILWGNADGRVAIWLMNGATTVGGQSIMGPGTGWSVVETTP